MPRRLRAPVFTFTIGARETRRNLLPASNSRSERGGIFQELVEIPSRSVYYARCSIVRRRFRTSISTRSGMKFQPLSIGFISDSYDLPEICRDSFRSRRRFHRDFWPDNLKREPIVGALARFCPSGDGEETTIASDRAIAVQRDAKRKTNGTFGALNAYYFFSYSSICFNTYNYAYPIIHRFFAVVPRFYLRPRGGHGVEELQSGARGKQEKEEKKARNNCSSRSPWSTLVLLMFSQWSAIFALLLALPLSPFFTRRRTKGQRESTRRARDTDAVLPNGFRPSPFSASFSQN